MIGKPDITICIPLYNGVEFLKETLISIRCQVYSKWRTIIGVNGHGPPGEVFQKVKAIISEINDDRFSVVNLDNVRGIAEADNALIDLAPTEWIAHLDADDLWHPHKLELQVDALNKLAVRQPQPIYLDVVSTACKYFGTIDSQPALPIGLLSEGDFKLTNPIVHSSILFKKGSIKYPSEEGGVVPQDYAAFLDLLGKGGQFYSIEHPLTFHRVHAKSHFNASGKQNPKLVASRFWSADYDIKQATVVSAFYNMPSKFKEDIYIHWLRIFGKVNCHLVIFTEKEYVPLFEEIRHSFPERTKIVVLERNEWTANTKWSEDLWLKQQEKDLENKIHSPDLYKIWYEKKEFVKKAIALNPFGHDKFVWCDAGLVRSEEIQDWMPNFARADRIPNDRLLLLEIDPFTADDLELQEDGLYGNFQKKNRIGGGIQAGSVETWLQWSDRYDEMMQRYINAGRFIGKDQSIMASMIIENPEKVLLIKPPGRYRNTVNIWFFLALWLGANNNRFKKLLEAY